jgi:hypothetical protein
MSAPASPARSRVAAWHLLLLFVISAGWEWLFLHAGVNKLDEGWPLYAAKRLHEGATLYRDVLFVFPPGHLLPAWIAGALDPPGVVAARLIYAAFNVSACLGIYLLGRKVMPTSFALFGALLLAVAAPRSHLSHLLFGYRYVLFSILALLAFSRRLDGRGLRWMFVAGLWAGVGVVFRLTPAAAVSGAIGVAILLASPEPRSRLRDGALYAAGLLAVATPVTVWLAQQVGLETLWREILVRPVAMTDQQSLPMPDLALLPEWDRWKIRRWFVALQFRLWAVLYLGYALALGAHAVRALRRREASPRALLVAIAVWGGIYFFRTLGRSDEPHLDSALPPVCLLLAHLFYTAARRFGARVEGDGAAAPAAMEAGWSRTLVGVACALFAVWIFVTASDRFLPQKRRGHIPLQSLAGEVELPRSAVAQGIDWSIHSILTWSRPGDAILDLTASPLFHVIANRNGPGVSDPLIPGSFIADEEEIRYLEALTRAPPALVLRPDIPFDRDPERAIERIAPRVAAWVDEHYRERGKRAGYVLMLPNAVVTPPEPAAGRSRGPR